MSRIVRYNPVTGEEILERAPVDNSLVGDQPVDAEALLVDVRILDGHDRLLATVETTVEEAMTRLTFLITQARIARDGYMSNSGVHDELEAVMEPLNEMWEALDQWGYLSV